MKTTMTLLALLGLTVAGAACGEDEATESTAAPVTTVAEVTTTRPVDLDTLLLDASDVGEGWTANTELSVEDLGSLAQSPCENTAPNPTIAARLQPTAGVIFEPDDGSMQGIQELAVEGEPSQLAADLDIVFEATDQCIGVESTTPDAEKVTYEALEIPQLGDQQMAATVTAFEPPDFQTTWRGHSAIVRVGGVAIMLNQFEILSSPDDEPTTSDADFIALLETAVAKLGG
jgi:hypothetical protein